MKIKIVRKGDYDWVHDMDKFIGETYEATIRPEKEEDEHGNFLDVFDVVPTVSFDGECASGWVWYSDAVEVIETNHKEEDK